MSIDGLQKRPEISDIFLLGNGFSLNSTTSNDLSKFFTIGTNRCWLWGETDILIWRDARITEELTFFEIEKHQSAVWIASQEKSQKTEKVSDCSFAQNQVDFWLTDAWKNKILDCNIRWNGIIFHALAVGKWLNPKATFHLLGVDLQNNPQTHHFFANIPGFNQGFYAKSWDENFFHFQKRLDMMLNNFERLKKTGIKIVNHSEKSRLTEVFGYSNLGDFLKENR